MIKSTLVFSLFCIHSFCVGMQNIAPRGIKRKREVEPYDSQKHQKKLKTLFKKHGMNEQYIPSIETAPHINFLLSDEKMISAFLSMLIMPTFSFDKNQIFYQSRGETLTLVDTGEKEAYIQLLLYEFMHKDSIVGLINKAIEVSKNHRTPELTIFVPSENEYIKSICLELGFHNEAVHETKNYGSTTAFVKYFHYNLAHALLSLTKQ